MTEPSGAPVLYMVLKGWPRISETFIANEIRLLEERGARVVIVSLRQPREDFTHAAVKAVKAPVLYLPEAIIPALARLVAANLRVLARNPRAYLRAAGVMLGRLAKTRRSATLKHLLQAGLFVDRLPPNGHPAHIHAHFAHSPTSVALYAGMLAGRPFSFTGHAKDVWTQDPGRLAEKIEASAFVVTCTGRNRDYLSSLGAGKKQVHLVYHGIDLGLFSRPDPPTVADPPYRLLTVARLTAKKGLDTVIEALALLAAEGLDFRYDLVGEGEERPRLEALIARRGLAGRTTFHGALPHERVLEHYREAHAFVLGCRVLPNGDRDGIPNVLVEALAMGVPAAATDVSALPEIVDHGRTGLLCPPDDPRALADNLRRLLTDRDLRAALIGAGQAKVREGFDSKRHIAALAAIFREKAGIGT